jgi:hypothetical protein
MRRKKLPINAETIIRSRYGQPRYITRISKKEYLVRGTSNFIRMGYSNDLKDEYEFVDFEGGPFLQIGDTLLMNLPYKEDKKIISLKPSSNAQESSVTTVLVEVE